jgi:mannose-1-phosphate guanylyltransferase
VAAGDPEHLVAMIGCRDLIVIQTHNATLICPANQAERIKELCKMVETQFGPKYI